MNSKITKPKKLKGIVASNKMQKTLVVVVNRLVEHPKYKKRIKISKRYKAHYDSGEFKEGDRVVIEETRPLSKDKRWRVVQE
ncbi:MAG: 30S ribosomal protein S17 [Candidatus Spechtbacteria bacterium RIFCSPLOWO2_02_FULL_38_8]|uniref:Small ribosomal subunit protein uS17 n=1 Tax=Candidatus Spechtbacteria bacterium RIFCSPLOWO2_02_FULL_38_8 TaxID=1802164 RepID=A0A1G2HH38_9BACT|nr:MAG: 30S ribosomal protein S17 [Candidatus Spechtbacteria bacterium RIFCSPLOWO2_02_FULL_38_8]